MSIFSNLSSKGLETQTDTLGGYSPLESGAYDAEIKALYVTTSASGAMALNLVADVEGREYRETIYITNKNKENFFTSAKTGKKVPLPGFTIINDLCLCAIGKELCELETETKVVKVYDFETKQELPKEVPMVTDVLGSRVCLGILKEVVDKNVKSGDSYVPSGETREQNTINKVFHAETHMTVKEALDGKKEAIFYDKWVKKHAGQTVNRSKGATGTAGAPKKPAAAAAPKKSLFS